MYLLISKETWVTVLLDRAAKKQKKEVNEHVYASNKTKSLEGRFNWKEFMTEMLHPYQMLFCEAIVLFLFATKRIRRRAHLSFLREIRVCLRGLAV